MSFADKVDIFYRGLDRSIFIDNEFKGCADYDCPLPIGFGQTISQPSLVCAMTYYLAPDKNSKVLEIGTGSGYQTAFLAEFSGEVFSVEKIDKLSDKAQARLEKLGFRNIRFLIGDGSEGWPDNSPYDRIMVTAAAREVPQPLLEQLANSGVMIIPIGEKGIQELLKIKKDENGNVKSETLGEVRFVELKGRFGWS